MNDIRLAKLLGWFSIGLGIAELAIPRRINRLAGMAAPVALLRLFGAREFAAGAMVLKNPDSAGPVWARVAGDVLDLAMMASMLPTGRNSQQRCQWKTALAAVAGITAVDLLCASSLQHRGTRALRTAQRTRVR